jgi:hypothetical protein
MPQRGDCGERTFLAMATSRSYRRWQVVDILRNRLGGRWR